MYSSTVGAKIKGYSKLAIAGIVLLLILHFINWMPLVSDHSDIGDKKDEHALYHGYDCSYCKELDEEQEALNRAGAAIWSDTVTSCMLIALAGIMVYGIGCIVETVVDGKSAQSPVQYYQQRQ